MNDMQSLLRLEQITVDGNGWDMMGHSLCRMLSKFFEWPSRLVVLAQGWTWVSDVSH